MNKQKKKLEKEERRGGKKENGWIWNVCGSYKVALSLGVVLHMATRWQ